MSSADEKATFMFTLSGFVTLVLSGPTAGILPDMSFQLAKTNIMLRTGPAESSADGDDATSHLPGLYFFLSSDAGGAIRQQWLGRSML